MPWPPRPNAGQDPWFTTREAWDQYAEDQDALDEAHRTGPHADPAHAGDQTNPHAVTAAQAGADPAGEADTKVGAHETAYTHADIATNKAHADSAHADPAHAGDQTNPHGVTAAQVGAAPVSHGDHPTDADVDANTAHRQSAHADPAHEGLTTIHVPSPVGQANTRMLEVQGNAWAFTDKPSGGGGGGDLAGGFDPYATPDAGDHLVPYVNTEAMVCAIPTAERAANNKAWCSPFYIDGTKRIDRVGVRQESPTNASVTFVSVFQYDPVARIPVSGTGAHVADVGSVASYGFPGNYLWYYINNVTLDLADGWYCFVFRPNSFAEDISYQGARVVPYAASSGTNTGNEPANVASKVNVAGPADSYATEVTGHHNADREQAWPLFSARLAALP